MTRYTTLYIPTPRPTLHHTQHTLPYSYSTPTPHIIQLPLKHYHTPHSKHTPHPTLHITLPPFYTSLYTSPYTSLHPILKSTLHLLFTTLHSTLIPIFTYYSTPHSTPSLHQTMHSTYLYTPLYPPQYFVLQSTPHIYTPNSTPLYIPI